MNASIKHLTNLRYILLPLVLLFSSGLNAAEQGMESLDLTGHWVGFFSIGIFLLAYALVMAEEFTHLRKSKPVLFGAGAIWAAIAWIYASHGMSTEAEDAVRHNLLEYAELMLFLLVAMTYINAMDERRVFDALRAWLIRSGFGFRSLFWITGTLAFFISPIADNLTTALMVWQKGIVDFWTFFALFIPSAVNFLVPSAIMHFAVPDVLPQAKGENIPMQRGARRIIALFLATIATAISFHNFLHMPPVIGMLTGLSYLQLFGYYLKKTSHKDHHGQPDNAEDDGEMGNPVAFDVFRPIARAEWDTLLFFYGVVLCVGGLGFIGYLSLASELMYSDWGATYANVAVGVLSAIVDNIPVMFAVLTMNPDMSTGQWLLVTLTAGVGGSMLSIGSAAGVALMGQARGKYTFFGHLKWTPAIAAGYVASILAHMTINSQYFTGS
jgi:Na+/H+ antiporter NhaD/arsenite permease-like protein